MNESTTKHSQQPPHDRYSNSTSTTMRFSLATLLAAASAASAEICPDGNGLYYKGRSGYYQVQCGVEYWTKTNLDSFSSSSAVDCASSCDSWSSKNPNSPCAAGSYLSTSKKCYLKPGDLTAEKRSNSNVISLILTH